MGRASTILGTALAILIVLAASPVDAAPLSPGDILVVSEDAGTVHHYSVSGTDLGIFVSGLASPAWMTTDNRGNIYVSEYTGNRLRKFSPSGDHLLTITTAFTPGGVAIGSDGTIYLAHYDAGAIHHYSSAGADLGVFATYAGCATGCGTDFIKFDAAGALYVGDFQPFGRVRLISPTGVDLGNFISLDGVEGLAFDSLGNLYASSTATGAIRKYSVLGTDLGVFAPAGSGFYGLAFDSAGNLYSSVTTSGTIEKFSSTGVALGSFGVAGRDLVVVPLGGPTTKDECKHGGWETFEFPRHFKNQGDCVRFVETGK